MLICNIMRDLRYGSNKMAENNDVIVFGNLRQGTSTVGEYAPVTAKAKAFVSENAHGVLCEIDSYHRAGELARASAKKTLALLNSNA